MVKDYVSDLITNVKNASDAGKESLLFPYSKFGMAIAEAMERVGYVKGVSKKGKKISKFIEIKLSYIDATPKITGVERVSKFSRRVYYGAKDIKPVLGGFSSIFLSTTKGILNDREAKKEGVGGEALFRIW